MFRVLFLTLALFSAQAGPAVMTSLTVPLRTLRPYPTLLATLGVMPVPTNFTPATSTQFASDITSSAGGDTITLTARVKPTPDHSL